MSLPYIHSFDPRPTLSGEIINWIVQTRKRRLREVQALSQGAVSQDLKPPLFDCKVQACFRC